MSDWLDSPRRITKALPTEGLRTAPTSPEEPRKFEPESFRAFQASDLGQRIAEIATETAAADPPGYAEGWYDGRAEILDALAGPSETMSAAGFTNRGSLNYALRERGFPQPVKVLRGIRLWDIEAVKDWARANRANTED